MIYISITWKDFLDSGSNIPQSSSCTTNNDPSRKLSKLDEPDMWDCVMDGRDGWIVLR